MIHLYAVTRDTRLPAPMTGLQDVDLEILSCGGLDAIISEHTCAPRADRSTALRHAAVVAAMAATTGTVSTVAVRFGIHHADRVSLQRAIRATASDLEKALDRVGEHLEFVIHMGAGPRGSRERTGRAARPGPQEDQPGRRYLEDRLAEQRRIRDAERIATAELRALTGPLNGQATLVVDRIGPNGPERCYLVDRSALPAFTDAASACLQERRELVLGGPWPPYPSATEGLGA